MEAEIKNLEQQVNTQAEQLKKLQAQNASAPAPGAASDTTVGGYGEIAYNSYRRDTSRNQADLKRFVILLGHRFSDRWSFTSEVEWEHAVASKDDRGESEIEQAYLNYQFAPGMNLTTGLFLMPFGFLNESHEPPVFYGVERNEVETRIIPSTWREGGARLDGITSFGLETNVGVTTGFDIAKFDDAGYPLASVHQELQLAKAHDLSYYGALNYRGVPGFTLGGAIFSGNATQGNADFKSDNTHPDFMDLNGRVTLWETHARWQKSAWDLQALYSEGTIGDAAQIDQILSTYNTAHSADRAFVPERFNGWLLQAGTVVWQRGDMSLAPFVRYERFNTQDKMPDGFAADSANADRVTTVGFSFKPLTQIVFKADHQSYHDNISNDRLNLGMGYMF